MTRPHRRLSLLGMAGVLALTLHVAAGSAQTLRIPSSLRYGSGLLHIPVASVLPHLVVTGTYSGFRVSVPNLLIVDRDGEGFASGEPFEKWMSDGSVAIGLFNRVEAGATLQHFGDGAEGGRMVGAFGRISVLPSSLRYLDVAAGLRYVPAPTFGVRHDHDFQPNRLGYPDSRIFDGVGGEAFNSTLTPYVVATARLPGLEPDPGYDVTLTAGWGGGMFSAGRELEFYRAGSSGGLFVGSAVHLSMGRGRLVNVMAEYDGFDANAGVQLDLGGLRLGAFSLGLGGNGQSTFRTARFGVLASVAFCAGTASPCGPGPHGPAPDTVVLPAPPPDTVLIERAPAAERVPGTPVTLCLATGIEVEVSITAAGDTLVGPAGVAIRELRPGVDFAGTYAGDEDWFEQSGRVEVAGREYEKSGQPVRPACSGIVPVAGYEGVPVFAATGDAEPYQVLYLPIAPGLWQRYTPRPPPGAGSSPRRSSTSGVRSSAVSMSDSSSSQVRRSPASRARAAVSRSTVSVLQAIPSKSAGQGARRPIR